MAISDIERNVQNASSLYAKVQAWGKEVTGKTKIGYVDSAYNNVLDALKKNKEIINQQVTNETSLPSSGPNSQNISRSYSTVVNAEWGAGDAISTNGFLKSGQKNLYQGVVQVFDYMSFFVQGKFGGKPQTVGVGIKKPYGEETTSRCLLGNKQIPNNLNRDNVDLKNQLGNRGFYVGVGLDLSTFGVNFFSYYFPKANGLTDSDLRSYAAQGKLFAEISITDKYVSTGTKASARLFHAMVTNSFDNNIGGTAESQLQKQYTLWLPYPLLLLNDYNDITDVYITTDDGQKMIGQGDTKFPLASSRYNHKDGEIYDFTPDYIMTYCNSIGGGDRGCKCDLDGTRTARVRLYLDESLKGTNGLPDDAELYKGWRMDVSKTETVHGALSAGFLNVDGLNVLVKTGHSTTGARTRTHDGIQYNEKTLNRQISEKIIQVLQSKGYGSQLVARGITGGAQYAISKKNQVACIISIHCNDLDNNTTACGSEVLYKNKNGQGSDPTKGHPLSQTLGDKIGLQLKAIKELNSKRAHLKHQPRWNGSTVDSKGKPVFTDTFLRTIGQEMPAVIIECGFISNKSNAIFLASSDGQRKIAQAIVRGIEEWYTTYVKKPT